MINTHNTNRAMLFSGNANFPLAERIARALLTNLGRAIVSRFSDGEVRVEILENVRGRDVFIVQPCCAPTNDNLMELLIMADALHRASAGRITAVIPYYGYCRQDRRVRSVRVPISAKVVADMLSISTNRVLTVDLHAEQVQGFFSIPVDNIYASPVLVRDILSHNYENVIVVSPDVGGVVRARAIAKHLNDADLAIIDKRRPQENQAEVMNIIGSVEGKTCIIVDDIVDTAGTLCQAADALKERGANQVLAYATHPVLSGSAVERLRDSALDEMVVTDTIPFGEQAGACEKIRQISISDILAQSINRINMEESISVLFGD